MNDSIVERVLPSGYIESIIPRFHHRMSASAIHYQYTILTTNNFAILTKKSFTESRLVVDLIHLNLLSHRHSRPPRGSRPLLPGFLSLGLGCTCPWMVAATGRTSRPPFSPWPLRFHFVVNICESLERACESHETLPHNKSEVYMHGTQANPCQE